MLLQVPSQEKKPSELDPATKEVMQSVLNVLPVFLDMLRSATAGRHAHSALELRRAETTSASQPGALLQAAPVEQLPGNRDIIAQPAYQVAYRGPRQCPRRFQSKL
jgi:hypothetical protein